SARWPARIRLRPGRHRVRRPAVRPFFFVFFFNDTATTEIYTLSLHDALPISTLHRHVDGASGATAVFGLVITRQYLHFRHRIHVGLDVRAAVGAGVGILHTVEREIDRRVAS